jgi:hypothetical protein
MAGKIVMGKLIFRLFFAKEFRKMARARQELELEQLSPAIKDREDFNQSGSCSELVKQVAHS